MSQGFAVPVRSRGLNIVLWVVRIAAAAMFLMAGLPKLASAAVMVQIFEKIGLGQWFRYLTGILEVAGAVALLVPALAVWGAAVLAVVMVGAIVTQLFVLGGSALLPAVLLAMMLLVLWAYRDRLRF
jgi:putative oxidoreductase